MVIEGARLYLRLLTVEDATEQYLGWLHNPRVTQYLEVRHNPPENLQDLRAYIQSGPGRLFLAIVLRDGNRHIGNIKLGDEGDMGILIGEQDEWGKGYGGEAIQLLTQYALGLGLSNLTAGCYKENEGSKQAFLRAGWLIVGDGDTIQLEVQQ